MNTTTTNTRHSVGSVKSDKVANVKINNNASIFLVRKTILETTIENGEKAEILSMIEAKEKALDNALENAEYYRSVSNTEFADNEESRANRLKKHLISLKARLKDLDPVNMEEVVDPETVSEVPEISQEKVLAVNLRKGDIIFKKSGRTSTIVSIDRRTETGTFATLKNDESGDIYTISYCNSDTMQVRRLGDHRNNDIELIRGTGLDGILHSADDNAVLLPERVEGQPRNPEGLAPSGYMVPA